MTFLISYNCLLKNLGVIIIYSVFVYDLESVDFLLFLMLDKWKKFIFLFKVTFIIVIKQGLNS